MTTDGNKTYNLDRLGTSYMGKGTILFVPLIINITKRWYLSFISNVVVFCDISNQA